MAIDKDAFSWRVAGAMSAFQFVEQVVRLYIDDALRVAQRCTAGRVPFELSADDFANEPLSRLIQLFGKLTRNQALVNDLHSFSRQWNRLDHHGVIALCEADVEPTDPQVTEYVRQLASIEDHAKRLRATISEESAGIRRALILPAQGADSIGPTLGGPKLGAHTAGDSITATGVHSTLLSAPGSSS